MPSRTPSNNFAVDFAGDFGRSGEFSSSLTIASDRQKNSTPTLPAENWSLENYRPATPPPCDWSHQTPPLATPQCALLRIGPSINTIGSRAEHRCEPTATKAPLQNQLNSAGSIEKAGRHEYAVEARKLRALVRAPSTRGSAPRRARRDFRTWLAASHVLSPIGNSPFPAF